MYADVVLSLNGKKPSAWQQHWRGHGWHHKEWLCSVYDIFHDIPGCMNLTDDFIVFGQKNPEHDRHLRSVLRQQGVRLNGEESFSQNQNSFLWTYLPRKKILKRSSIQTPSSNASEVKSLLGTVCRSIRWLNRYASLHPGRYPDVEFSWAERTGYAKTRIHWSSSYELFWSYESNFLVDASSVGVGAILCEDVKIGNYGSRALSDVKQIYSQTEREMLAIVWGAEHYLFTCTDHNAQSSHIIAEMETSTYALWSKPHLRAR